MSRSRSSPRRLASRGQTEATSTARGGDEAVCGRNARRRRRRCQRRRRRLLNISTRVLARRLQRSNAVVTSARRAARVVIRNANGSTTGRGPRVDRQSVPNARSNSGGQSDANGVRGLGRGSFPAERRRGIGSINFYRY